MEPFIFDRDDDLMKSFIEKCLVFGPNANHLLFITFRKRRRSEITKRDGSREKKRTLCVGYSTHIFINRNKFILFWSSIIEPIRKKCIKNATLYGCLDIFKETTKVIHIFSLLFVSVYSAFGY